MKEKKPTSEFYNLFEMIYSYYNEKLYNGELPNCMFVLTRKKNTFGYFIANRWRNNENFQTDEIAINPLMFGKYELVEILKTVAHEMCHLWQFRLGSPSERTYHNKEWGDKMESIGLMPSNTGLPGGKKTGQQMMEYVIENGPFHLETIALLNKNIFKQLWFDNTGVEITSENITSQFEQIELPEDHFRALIENTEVSHTRVRAAQSNPFETDLTPDEDKKRKIKYSCPICDYNVWGKPGLKIRCNECKSNYEETKPKLKSVT